MPPPTSAIPKPVAGTGGSGAKPATNNGAAPPTTPLTDDGRQPSQVVISSPEGIAAAAGGQPDTEAAARLQGVDPAPAGTPKVKVTRSGIVKNDAPLEGAVNFDELDMHRPIGSGSNGEVFLYKHRTTRKRYAVKVVRLGTSKSEAKKIIMSEVAMGLAVQGDYTVRLENAFLRDNTLYLVMEFMDFGTLEDYLKKQPKLSEPAAGFVAKQLLMGLADLHRRHDGGSSAAAAAPSTPAGSTVAAPADAAAAAGGARRAAYVHRDLKPANIMVNKQGAVKLADFGGAGAADSMGLATVVGTHTYMAPERIGGKMYSTPSDVWSLGVIVAQMLLGRYPFSNSTNYFDLLSEVSNFTCLRLPDDYSRESQDFIDACLRPQADDRQSAEQLLSHPWILRHGTPEGDGSKLFKALLASGGDGGGGDISRQVSEAPSTPGTDTSSPHS